ncbi:MAG: restriction endonuclease subunit S, partial [Hymenobacter sp.]
MNWKLMKLGALLTQSKELSTAPDANRRIRVKLNVGGVEKRPVSNEVEGATNYYTRKAGQFIFGTQNFHKGAFGVIPPELDGFETSNDIPSFDVSKDCLPEWIFFYFKVGDRYKELEKLVRGVGSKRVHPKQIFEFEIPVPPVAEQLTIIEQVQASAARQRMITEESVQQLTHLTQLRQALLREAMQGQLLPQDPTDEPAAMLLKKIQAARAAIIKGGKSKAGTLFLEEAETVEGLFDIPASWAWCTLDDISVLITDGTHQTPSYTEQGRPFLSAQNIKPFRFMPEVHRYVSEEAYQEYTRIKKPELGDLLIARVGAGIGECAVIDKQIDFAFYVSLGLVKLISGFLSADYLAYMINGPFGVAYSKNNIASKGGSAGNFNLTKIRTFPIPLPPLAEQHRIVAKLAQLLQHCDALEQRIRESRRLAEQLLATALREALAPPTGT